MPGLIESLSLHGFLAEPDAQMGKKVFAGVVGVTLVMGERMVRRVGDPHVRVEHVIGVVDHGSHVSSWPVRHWLEDVGSVNEQLVDLNSKKDHFALRCKCPVRWTYKFDALVRSPPVFVQSGADGTERRADAMGQWQVRIAGFTFEEHVNGLFVTGCDG